MKHPQEKNSNPPNTHKKQFQTHEIPTRKNLGTLKYQQESNSNPPNTHKKKFWTQKTPSRKKF